MRQFSPTSIVVDANIVVWAVLPIVAAVDTLPYFRDWRRRHMRVIAPALLPFESVSAVRRAVAQRLISPDDGRQAIQDMYDLDVEVISPDLSLSLAAFTWAERLGQSRAYDGAYLALADQHNAELWTADKRWADAARQIGLRRVRGVA